MKHDIDTIEEFYEFSGIQIDPATAGDHIQVGRGYRREGSTYYVHEISRDRSICNDWHDDGPHIWHDEPVVRRTAKGAIHAASY